MGGYTWHGDEGTTAVTTPTPTAPTATPEEARINLGEQFANAARQCRENGYGAARLDKLAGYQQLKENN